MVLSLKRHLFPHCDRVKMLAQGFLDLFIDAALHLEYVFHFFELGTKAASAKAAFDTLRNMQTLISKLGRQMQAWICKTLSGIAGLELRGEGKPSSRATCALRLYLCDPGCPPTPPKPWRISKSLKSD